MTQKSLETFLREVRSGRLDTNRHIVFIKIRQLGGANLDTLRNSMRMPHQSLTAALSKLNDMGLIYQDVSGQYQITSYDDVERVAHQRDRQRFEKWKKVGEKNGWFSKMFQEDLGEPLAVGVDDKGQTYLL